ncbi:cupin domain-containing protein [Actinoplanes sp. NPDC049802]|uniref:cupin domain-containing protein n=1 Tax=Actinoplanes sp. NPDC049802 TaxID=3154742 RepID=UPI003408A119
MRKLTFADLDTGDQGPRFTNVLPGHVTERGGFRIYPEPNHRTHDGPGRHTHPIPEVFYIVQGQGEIEIEGEVVDEFQAGDAILIEPEEDHHLISRGEGPLAFVWMHLEPAG